MSEQKQNAATPQGKEAADVPEQKPATSDKPATK